MRDQAKTDVSLMVKLLGLRSCAALLTAVTQADQAEAAEAEAEEAILWAAAQILTTQLLQTRHKQTVKREAVTGSRAIAVRDTREHSQANQRDGLHSAYPSTEEKAGCYSVG